MGNKRKTKAADAATASTESEAVAPALVTGGEADAPELLLFGQFKLPVEQRTKHYNVFFCVALAAFVFLGYHLRVKSIGEFGHLLHGSDPWFNYRAAEYMSTHGWSAFFRWFDYMSWYPLGRPVGSTTYPGLQFTAVAIHRTLAAVGMPMSLNNVCVLMPAWFSVAACLLLTLLAHETTGAFGASVVATALFAVIPAHLMRSMAGEFDNESIAVSAMILVFYLWVRSLRTRASWPIGALVGVAYGYMVAAWGGYIFVLNMVALHAGIASMVDWARNTYNPSLLRSYALFYVIGTALATRVPPVGMAPFSSLEQLGALVVLLFLCGQSLCEAQRIRAGVERFSKRGVALLIRIYAAFFVGVAIAAACAPVGFIRPLSLQAAALMRLTSRTGNPLVDVMLAEDASSLVTAWQMLLLPFFGWMLGVSVFLYPLTEQYTYAKCFLMLYGAAGLYFATHTIRMMVMAAPVACIFTAVVVQWLLDFVARALFWAELPPPEESTDAAPAPTSNEAAEAALKKSKEEWVGKNMKRVMLHMAPMMLFIFVFRISGFVEDVQYIVEQIEAPGIVFRNQPGSGLEGDVIDDYFNGFMWLRDSTPEDARVLGWFDYGFQISSLSNRTSLADGNTWNHEHIATIGKMLTSPVEEAHSLVRHMADYVIVFAGEAIFSDAQRSPLLARIANSVYHDICPGDPLCLGFGYRKKEKLAKARRSRHAHTTEDEEEEAAPVEYEPTPLLAKSLLYHLHASGVQEGVTLDEGLFKHVYASSNGLIRIYKVMNVSEESKKWIADKANRVCDPPGSWICPGQYPPAKEIQDMLANQHANYRELLDAYEEAAMAQREAEEYGYSGSDL